MVFKFGFDGDDAAVNDEDTACGGHDEEERRAWIVPLPLVGEMLCTGNPNELDTTSAGNILPDMFDVVELAGGDVQLRKTIISEPQPSLAPDSSDLVPGKYEGGYKLWECAGDLICFLHKSMPAQLAGSSVLELGAGHALPALYAVQKGASLVDVADFNEDVLLAATVANIRLNCNSEIANRMRMVAGDWAGIPQALGTQYDIVLAAEVVYAVEGLGRLSRCILQVLKPGGMALVAGKTYYFGVGGGMRAFQKSIRATAEAMRLDVALDVVDEIRDGRSNVREILRIRKGDPIGKQAVI